MFVPDVFESDTMVFCLGEKQGMIVSDDCSLWSIIPWEAILSKAPEYCVIDTGKILGKPLYPCTRYILDFILDLSHDTQMGW